MRGFLKHIYLKNDLQVVMMEKFKKSYVNCIPRYAIYIKCSIIKI